MRAMRLVGFLQLLELLGGIGVLRVLVLGFGNRSLRSRDFADSGGGVAKSSAPKKPRNDEPLGVLLASPNRKPAVR